MPSGHLQHHFDIGNHRIITLDSLDGPPYRVGHHLGRLCDDRIAFLDDALTTRGGRHATVFIHHPPFDTGILGMDMIKLEDGEALLDLLGNHGNLHVICGHIHRTINGQTKGVPWTVLKSPCHQGLVDLDTPNSHLSTDEAGAYGLVLLTDNGVIIHHQDVGTGARVFGGYGTED
jgi:3',5'-cyclic AMP phosphodiesterase CpdA